MPGAASADPAASSFWNSRCHPWDLRGCVPRTATQPRSKRPTVVKAMSPHRGCGCNQMPSNHLGMSNGVSANSCSPGVLAPPAFDKDRPSTHTPGRFSTPLQKQNLPRKVKCARWSDVLRPAQRGRRTLAMTFPRKLRWGAVWSQCAARGSRDGQPRSAQSVWVSSPLAAISHAGRSPPVVELSDTDKSAMIFCHAGFHEARALGVPLQR